VRRSALARSVTLARAATLAACAALTACAHAPGLGLDPQIAPGDDFYAHANGRWLAATPIPDDRVAIGSFSTATDTVEARVRAIVEAAAAGPRDGSERAKVGALYASFMDEAAIEARGLAPLAPTLARIAAITDRRALAAFLGGEVRADVDVLNCTHTWTDRPLGLWIEQDLNDPSRNTAYLVQGGLGLPDRAYYLEPTGELAEQRAAYARYLEQLLTLAGVADPGAQAAAALGLETELATHHATAEATGSVAAGNNPRTRAELERIAGLDWAAFLDAAGLGAQPHFVVWQPAAIEGFAALVGRAPLDAWKSYLTTRAIARAAGVLPRAFADARFDFYGRTLFGVPADKPRWKRGLDLLDGELGMTVGRLYVERHFPARTRADIVAMVEQIRAAFVRRIDALAWMAPETKAQAKAKVAVLEVGIGHPDTWPDISGLVLADDDLFGNVERASREATRRELAKLGQKPDRRAWCMNPHEVNAVNLPLRNAIDFPAGILEAPFYHPDATAAVNYGGTGATVGHELVHSFDDAGAEFDADGRVRRWWTPDDYARFKASGAELVAQYAAYAPFPGVTLNGQLTLSENIADLAGLAAAYDAWAALPAASTGRGTARDLFLAYAQAWRTKIREPAERAALLTDGHAPPRFRAQTVRNLDAWYDALGVRPGQALYLAPEARVRIW
jgi:putative endopeptidase